MTSIAKLKDKARKYEQKEDWKAAIQVYQKVLQHQESRDDLDLDLGLFNRIGDLNLRIGRTDEAVDYYEQAADRYAEIGFYNNAIALCNKALRHRPDRPAVYLKLSRLYSEQGFQTDARRWILKYAERQLSAGQVEEALVGLEEFANLSNDPEIRELLAQQMAAHDHPEEALEQLRAAYVLRARAGDLDKAARIAEEAREIDPHADLEAEAKASGVLDRAPEPRGRKRDSLAGLARLEEPEEETAPGGVEGLETRAETVEEEADTSQVSGLEPSPSARTPGASPEGADVEMVGGLQSFDEADDELDEDEEPEPLPLLDTGYEDELYDEPDELEEPDGLEGPEEVAEPEVRKLEEPVAAAPDEADDEDVEVISEAEYEAELGVRAGDEPTAPAPEEVAAETPGTEPEAASEAVDAVAAGEAVEPEEHAELEEPTGAGEVVEPEEAPAATGPVEPAQVEAVDAGPMDLDLSGAEPETIGPPGSEDAQELEPLDLSFEGGVLSEMDMLGGEAGDLDLDLGSLVDVASGGSGGAGVSAQDLDIEAILERGRELVSRGLMSEALRELRLLSESDAEPDVFRDALLVVKEILRHDPNDLTALQRRVEYSARLGDREALVEAYLDLAESLVRIGVEDKAEIMFRRVVELDPGNETAREALGIPSPEEKTGGTPAVEPGPGSEPVSDRAADDDLDALLEGMGPEDVPAAEGEPADTEVAAMLEQFRAKVTEGADPEDAGDHYDLGLAFKEMGLVDEAIAEFRVALTGGEDRLKVYEELGQCFVLKGRYDVALKVLDRALRTPAEDETDLLGVYYQMGQCHEALGQTEAARRAYQKVLAIDESFADVPDRVARL